LIHPDQSLRTRAIFQIGTCRTVSELDPRSRERRHASKGTAPPLYALGLIFRASLPLVLQLFPFFRSRRPLNDSHRMLIEIVNLRCLLEFSRSSNGIEAARLPAPQLRVEAALSQKLAV
jgi:hypothetical protein